MSSSDHFFQILHAFNKVELCCSIFSIQTSWKIVPSDGELVRPFGNVFVFVPSVVATISSICSRNVFDSAKCKARFLFFDCLSLLFIDTSFIVLQCFSSSKFSPLLSSWPEPLRAFEISSGWSFSLAFIPPEAFSIPNLSDSVARSLLHVLLQIF